MKTPIVREFTKSTIGVVHQTGAQLGERHRGLTVELSLPDSEHGTEGFAEIYGGEYHAEIGLWFSDKKLVDYDGVFELPAEVALMLREAGYTVDE